MAAFTALQALRDQAHVRAGDKVLVNGAAGGVGSFTVPESRRALTRSGTLIGVGAPPTGRWIGPLGRAVKMRAVAPLVRQKMTFFMAEQRRDDLAVLAQMLEPGTLTPVVDRVYPLSEVREAIRYLETGHARGKIVITL